MTILELMERKRKILLEFGRKERALRDEHAKRPPIKCGMTVHPGYGCDLGCIYCYLPEMRIGPPKPSLLSWEELCIALAHNPYFLPSSTMIAIGSITEPFHEKIVHKTLEFSEAIKLLGNPSQVSTKLTSEKAFILMENLPKISFLVSISTSIRDFEPRAPSLKDRIKFASELREIGGNSFLFLRPIIPGVTERDRKLFDEILKADVKGIVLGGLRVNEGIANRIREKADITEILRRANKKLGKKQVQIYVKDLKEKIEKKLIEHGFRVFPLACAANAYSHNIGCALCSNLCRGKMPEVRAKEIEEFLERYFSLRVKIRVNNGEIEVFGKIPRAATELLKAYYRRKVRIYVDSLPRES